MSIAALRRAAERWGDAELGIAGLLHQDAQKREGTATELAMMKERDRLAESRQERADRRAHGYRMAEAEKGHEYAMAQQEARLASQEGIVDKQIGSSEKMGFAGIQSREDIAQWGISSSEIIAGMNLSSAESQNESRIAAQKFLQNERLDFQAGENDKDRVAQKENTDALIAGREAAAQMTIDARWNELALARQYALDDAISTAASTQQKQAYEAKVAQAEAEEKGLAELYGELGTEGLDEARRDEILNLIYDAQDRVAAAWRATGIAPLMSDKHIKESQWSFLAKNIVGAIALEYRNQPEAWKDLIISLHGKKDTSSFKKSVEGITPTIQAAITDSLVRAAPKDKSKIRDLVIDYLANYRATELSGAYGEAGPPWEQDPTLKESASTTGWFGRSEASVAIETLSGMSDADLEAYVQIGALEAAEDAERPTRPGRSGNAYEQGIRKAKLKDPAYLLEILMEARDKPAFGSRRGKIDELIGKLQIITGQTSNVGGGMLNEGVGMIAAVDAGLSPQSLAQWEPEAVEARQQQRMA